MAHDDAVLDQAVEWAVRMGDASFDDWDAFTAWLERDPAHAAAYDRVMAGAADAAELLPALPEAGNDDLPAAPAFTRRRWIGAAVAASVAVVAGLGAWHLRGGSYAIETAPGEHRAIALGDGDRIDLAGGSRIVLDRSDPRFAALDRGQALFTIRHDEAKPFRVEAGGNELVDIGTVFDVKHDAGTLTLAVSEGAVAFNPRRQNVQVNPGQVLTSAAGSAAYRVAAISLAQVGEWREGRLTFQDRTLAEVAADLSRASGLRFEVAPAAAGKRVSGSLLVDPVRADPRAAGPLLGVTVRPAGDGWVIEGN